MSDSRAILCMLILIRLKIELSPFDRLRLHKAALMLNVFSGRDCFDIEDETQEYYPIVDSLAAEIKNLQTKNDANTAATLQSLLDNQDSRIIEAYRRSTPFVIQSASFVNSITDCEVLLRVSAVCGILKHRGRASVIDIEKYFREYNNSGITFSPKDLITILVNLEKTGMVVKDDNYYRLDDKLRDVDRYERLLY